MKWRIEWVKSHIEGVKFMGYETIEARSYRIDEGIGVFFNKNGELIHSVPADKVIVTTNDYDT